jgi:signal transduction histidine kinase
VEDRPGRARAALLVAALGAAFGALQATTIWMGLKQEPNLPFTPSLPRLLLWQVPSWGAWGLLAPAVLWLAAAVPPDRRGRWLAVHVPAALAASALHGTVSGLLAAWAQPWGPHKVEPLLPLITGRIRASLHFELLTYFVILGAAYAVDYRRRFRDRELRTAQLEGRLAEARLESLRLQLQPHFLFNALHTVAGLVRQGENAAAVEMLARLSGLLRATLDGGGRALVPLSEELALADHYLSIQEVRFADRLRVERAIDAGLLGAEVPPFLLQPLLENALRHGLGLKARSGWLRLVAERTAGGLTLEVHDDGRGLAADGDVPVEGVGLANTRARLEQLFGAAARLELLAREGGGAVARVTLPLAARAAPLPHPPEAA